MYNGGLIDNRKEKKDFSHLEVGKVSVPTYLTKSKAQKAEKLYVKRNQKTTSACFTADTKILTSDNSYKNIKEIKYGDELIDAHGNIQRVIDTMNKTWQGNLYKIKPFGIEEIKVTPEHPFLTLNGWKEARQLTTKDYLIIPVNQQIKDKTDYWFETDKDFLKMYGLFLAEGNSYIKTDNGHNTYKVCFTFHKKEQHLVDFVSNTVKRIWNLNINTNYKKDSLAVTIGFSNKELSFYFKEIAGDGCQNKKIHSKFMLLEPRLQREILNGWLLGDGSSKRQRDIVGVTTSQTLVQQMQNICFRNKMIANVRFEKTPKHKRQVWRFSISKLYFNGKSQKRKQDKWKGYFVTDRILVKRIDKIYIQKPEKKYAWGVYNLTIENSHTYTANNVAVHNCGAYSGELALSIDTDAVHEPAFIYRNRLNYPDEGMYHYDIGDILKAKGACLNKKIPVDEKSYNDYSPTFDDKIEAQLYTEDAYVVLENDKFTIDDIAYIVNDLKRPVIIYTYWKEKEWNTDFPIATGELTPFTATYRHYVTVLPNSAYIYKKQKYVIIQDSAWFGGKNIRHLSEDWINKRVYTGLYFTEFKYKKGDKPKPYNFTRDLKYGDSGEDVNVLQLSLQKLGFFPSNLKPTNYFGGITRQAVKDFQKKYEKSILWTIGLKKPTGYFGISTRKKLLELLS